jgi:hypothetical protein
LKNRIQARYPNIVFHSSKMMNKGILDWTPPPIERRPRMSAAFQIKFS